MDLRLDGGGSVWQKCSRHDFRFVFGGGVCPFCLHEQLSSLCPDCSRNLPCSCTPRSSVSDSAGEGDVSFTGVGSVGRVDNLIEREPAFRRSRSMAVPFLWPAKPETGSDLQPGRVPSLWRLFRGISGEAKTKAAAIMRRSRSVAVSDAGELLDSPAPVTNKGNGWYFPSPIKVFRQSRVSKMMFQQRSPLYRG
ncbi:unnamed protein product [Microthlaspi erraticum]|uniref:Uncharacterized protein n=1 Tax=Microthlaspi erraticum TaxID=1685480 RepID=A0A6D2I5A4_9BRAS|nr:unnamed protein product [Microthlaspi erraticum]